MFIFDEARQKFRWMTIFTRLYSFRWNVLRELCYFRNSAVSGKVNRQLDNQVPVIQDDFVILKKVFLNGIHFLQCHAPV
jgi:hypothetical protein